MKPILRRFWRIINKAKHFVDVQLLSYPKRVCCNVCGWEGRHFLSDEWHKRMNCPKCASSVRQRLFIAALENIEHLSLMKIIKDRRIIHFAPESAIKIKLSGEALSYITADYLRDDCDVRLDLSEMSEVKGESYDVVMAFDVLEHVPDYQKSIDEMYRVLTPGGYAILAVPQKDDLEITYEDTSITTPEGRLEHFGQEDHLRVFGDDFPAIIQRSGFEVDEIDESSFSQELVKRNVLFPPYLSSHLLATNHRSIFFCRKP